MNSVTLIVSIFYSILALIVPPAYCLVVFIAALVSYPNYLKIDVATIDFSVCRIVIFVIMIRLLILPHSSKRFRLLKIDKAVIAVFICQIIAGVTTAASASDLLVNRAGAIFDMLLPYFAVRLIIHRRQDLVQFLVGSMIVMIPFAFVGVYQCVTGSHLYAPLENSIGWRIKPSNYDKRFGFSRANAAFTHPIVFGLIYAMLLPLFVSLWHILKRHRRLLLVGFVCIGLGVLSTVSSGSYLAMLSSIFFVFCYRHRRYWKLALSVFLVGLLCVEILSNRHWYHVFCDYTLNASTAWYRGRLMEVALFEGGMSGHWLLGYGYGVDPMWSARIDGRDHTDMVNHYLLILSQFGLMGLVPFGVLNWYVIKYLIAAWKRAVSLENRFLIWGLCASFLGLAMTAFSVSLVGLPSTIYFMMVGITAVLPGIFSSQKVQAGAVKRKRVQNTLKEI